MDARKRLKLFVTNSFIPIPFSFLKIPCEPFWEPAATISAWKPLNSPVKTGGRQSAHPIASGYLSEKLPDRLETVPLLLARDFVSLTLLLLDRMGIKCLLGMLSLQAFGTATDSGENALVS